MTGTIYKEKGRWFVNITIKGRRIRRAASDKWEAKALLRELQSIEAASRDEPYQLADVISGYLASLRIRSSGKPGTIHFAEQHAGNLERFFGGDFDVSRLSSDDVDLFCKERLGCVRPVTVNASLKILRAALRRAGLETPFKLLREGSRLPHAFTPDDVQRLIKAAEEPIDLILLLAARAGLRHQEILHLQVRDVDTGALEVRVTAKPGWLPKSHSERAVPISDQLAARITRYSAGRAATDWLFPGFEGTHRVNVYVNVRNVFQACDLYNLAHKPGLHSLRRTWATELLGRGADIETVRQLGGWSDLRIVQRYVTSTDKRKRAAIATLDD